MSVTTIKVASELRDQLNETARAEGLTAGSLVEKLLKDYLWRQQVDAALNAMGSMTPEELKDYMDEFHAMDAALNDGLEDDPWDPS